LKQITVDNDTTAADAFQLATDRPTWRAVASPQGYAHNDDEWVQKVTIKFSFHYKLQLYKLPSHPSHL